MISARFIAFVVASVAALAVVNGAPLVNTVAVAAPDAETGTLKLCAEKDYEECDNAVFVEGGCTSLPSDLHDHLSSVEIPAGWACTFFDTYGGCNGANDTRTTLLAPGSPDLALHNFDESANTFSCTHF
ncbi:hypothetical protein FB451DRAFT_1432591 [Mycena latifolia]|nr:hypothetical protein FB451DRAFT_1432591 [Mycena latifolia]